jgi:hypothetical protein
LDKKENGRPAFLLPAPWSPPKLFAFGFWEMPDAAEVHRTVRDEHGRHVYQNDHKLTCGVQVLLTRTRAAPENRKTSSSSSSVYQRAFLIQMTRRWSHAAMNIKLCRPMHLQDEEFVVLQVQ